MMNKRSLGALVVLNLVLVIALAVVSLSPQPAEAQFGGGSNYIMIAGEITGRTNQNAVYIVETQSARMISVLFNSSNKTFQVIAGCDLAADARAAGGGPR